MPLRAAAYSSTDRSAVDGCRRVGSIVRHSAPVSLFLIRVTVLARLYFPLLLYFDSCLHQRLRPRRRRTPPSTVLCPHSVPKLSSLPLSPHFSFPFLYARLRFDHIEYGSNVTHDLYNQYPSLFSPLKVCDHPSADGFCLAVFSSTRALPFVVASISLFAPPLRRCHRFISCWLRVEPDPHVDLPPSYTPDFSVPTHPPHFVHKSLIDFRLSTASFLGRRFSSDPYEVKRP